MSSGMGGDQPTFNTHFKVTDGVLIGAALCLGLLLLVIAVRHLFIWYRRIRRQQSAYHRQHAPVPQPKVVISALPKFAYRTQSCRNDAGGMSSSPPPLPKCSICLSRVEEGEMVRLMPKCKHMFHVDCIDLWLQSHSTCPICRARAEPQPAGVAVAPD